MLLLSSATRILATKRPPDLLHPCFASRPLCGRTEHQPLCGRAFIETPEYWSIQRIGRQSPRTTSVSEMNMASTTLPGGLQPQKTGGAARAAPPVPSPFLVRNNYQGTSLRNPFFFLLVDSFFWSPLFCESSVFAASVASLFDSAPATAPSLFASVPVAGASAFAGVSVAPSAAGGFFAGSSLAAGLAVAGAVPASFGGSVVPSLSVGATLSDVAAGSDVPPTPGVTTAMSPVRAFDPPGVSMSIGDTLSDSGCKFGAPFLAATFNSPLGPFDTNASGFLTRLVCGLGVFCSAVIHATALGSGCGTGAPNALSLSFAPGTMPDNG